MTDLPTGPSGGRRHWLHLRSDRPAAPTRRRFRPAAGLLTAFVLVATLAQTPAGAAGPDGADPADEAATDQGRSPDRPSPIIPELVWESCHAEFGDGFECATATVPLDHDRPRGEQIELALVRLPATDQENRIGSLFLNPGGPGGSGVELALVLGPAAEFLYGPEVSARYDIVGFDPRGIHRSTPLVCFDSAEEAAGAVPPVPFPVSSDEIRLTVAANRTLTEACRREGGPIGRHLSTANVARDLDLLRAAVGDERLNYLGFSYGTYLGTVYANLFPHRVGAMVFDAVVDPISWTNREGRLPFTARYIGALGAEDSLDRLFELCSAAGPDRCPLGTDPAGTFESVLDRLGAEPVVVPLPSFGIEEVLDDKVMLAVTFQSMYSATVLFPIVAELVAAVDSGADPATVGGIVELLYLYLSGGEAPDLPYANNVEGQPGVMCSDTGNPRSHRAWVRAADDAAVRYPHFGRLWTWLSSPCASWPFVDRDNYQGPWATGTATPVLVVGNLYDPATPYEGAEIVHDLLDESALVTVDAVGHASLGINECAGRLVGTYLIDPSGTAADIDGSFCAQELDPFAPPTTSFRSTTTFDEVRSFLLPASDPFNG